jgi:hypothetical protein
MGQTRPLGHWGGVRDERGGETRARLRPPCEGWAVGSVEEGSMQAGPNLWSAAFAYLSPLGRRQRQGQGQKAAQARSCSAARRAA